MKNYLGMIGMPLAGILIGWGVFELTGNYASLLIIAPNVVLLTIIVVILLLDSNQEHYDN